MNRSSRAALCLLLAGLAACSSQPPRRGGHGPGHGSRLSGNPYRDDLSLSQERRYHSSKDSVPDGPPPDFSKLPEPVPRNEPLSLYGNKSPYTVLGHTYVVLPQAHGYVERGTASYYGSKFHRYKTSTLEDYDMYDYSAAHKTLPLPSYVRVTNLANGKSVVVRVNDRGPFKDDRLIDLSYIAAVKIGIWPSGTGQVEVRALDPGVTPPPAPLPLRPPAAGGPPSPAHAVSTAMPPRVAPVVLATPRPPVATTRQLQAPSSAIAAAAPAMYLQAGAFGDRSNAERVAARLRAAGISPVQVISSVLAGRMLQRVRVGPLPNAAAATAVTRRIVQIGLPPPRPTVN